MSRFYKRRSAKLGKKPGDITYIGRDRTSEVTIDVIDYTADSLNEISNQEIDKLSLFTSDQTTTWINITGVHDPTVLEKIGNIFKIHSLVLEDIANTDLRPKIEEFENHLFISLKMISMSDTDSIKTEQVSLIIGPHYVITFQETPGDVFEPVRKRLRKTVPRERFRVADYLAYAIVDAVIDHYFIVLEKLGDTIEQLEERLMKNSGQSDLEVIHILKRELIYFRKQVWPLREVVGGLERSESKMLSSMIQPYLRDLYEHVIQVIDTTETYRDMVTGLLDLYLSQVSNRMNEIMKVLTIIATIFIPLGFLAGVYGMNFDSSLSSLNMPELGFKYGYIMFWVLVVIIGGSLLYYFKRKKWL